MSSVSNLLPLTIDAYRFLLHNGLIIKNAPLQTYVSALLFSPTTSLTRELFKKEEPQWVLTGPVIDKHRSPLVRTLEGHSNVVRSVAFSPNGKLIASGSFDRTIKVWEAVTGEVRHTLKGHSDVVLSVAFSIAGDLIASGSFDKTIKVWRAVTGELDHTLNGHSRRVRSVAFSPAGNRIASGSGDKTIKTWDIRAPQQAFTTLRGHT